MIKGNPAKKGNKIMLSREQLISGFRKMGVKNSDVIMVHASYKSLGDVPGGADTAIDALIDAVGPDGTVLFSTFDFHSWTESHYFDIHETRSKMGIITELARLRKDSMRTPHPIYSFAVIGKRKHEFAACDDIKGFGEKSVFALFHRLNGIVISIGISDLNNTFTITHYAEEIANCKYRRHKNFSGIYIGNNGIPETRTYSMLVRKHGVLTDMAPALTELIKRGVIKKGVIGQAEVLCTPMQEFCKEMSKIIKDHPEKLHKLEREIR